MNTSEFTPPQKTPLALLSGLLAFWAVTGVCPTGAADLQRLREGYPAPPAECSAYVGYDRDRVLPGYILPSRGGHPTCVPFATTAAHPPEGYHGDFYVDEFSDARLRALWQACRSEPGCSSRLEEHIKRRLPPQPDRSIRSPHARYLLGMVDQDDNHLDLRKIRRPAFFGRPQWNEDVAKAEKRTYTIEFTAIRGPYERLIRHMRGTIRLRGWYVRGAGVPDGRGHLTRALIIMSNGGGEHLVAIDDPRDRLYHVDPTSGMSVPNAFPNSTTGAWGQRAWRDLLYRLNAAGYDVLGYDRRGIGISGGYCDTDTLQQGRDLLNMVAALSSGSGVEVLTPAGRALHGKAAITAIIGNNDAKALPVFLAGSSRGTMSTGWAMTRNFYRACDYDLPADSCGPPTRLGNIRGAIMISDFSAGPGYVTAPTSQDDRERGLYTAGTETQFHIVFFPSSEILAGIHTWPSLFIARGAWDYAESLEGAMDAYRRVSGPKDLVIVRAAHPFGTWPAAERARVARRIIAFARAVLAGERAVPDAGQWSNAKQLLATSPDDGWQSPRANPSPRPAP